LVKILTLDIETKPALSYHWRMFKQNIGVNQVVEPGGILCVSCQWVGSNVVETFTEWDNGEEGMLRAIHDRIMEADAVVTKNGIKFDIPHLRVWFLKYGLPPLPALTHIDLEKVARYQFAFLSNKLEFIAPFLGVGNKMDTGGFELWTDVINGDEKARRKMVRYCERDVRITTKLYLKMRAWIPDHPAMRALGSEACPACQSLKTQKRGYRMTKCFRIARHQCNDCGSWFSGKRTKVA